MPPTICLYVIWWKFTDVSKEHYKCLLEPTASHPTIYYSSNSYLVTTLTAYLMRIYIAQSHFKIYIYSSVLKEIQ
jgi:hypothetical protein